MASSSQPTEFWNSPTTFSIKNRYCYCNRKATVKISESEKNPDKLYFCCSKCRYFKWYDGGEEEEVNSRRSNQDTNRERNISRARVLGISERQSEPNVELQRQLPAQSVLGNVLLITNMLLLAIFIFIQIVKSISS